MEIIALWESLNLKVRNALPTPYEFFKNNFSSYPNSLPRKPRTIFSFHLNVGATKHERFKLKHFLHYNK